MKNSQCPWQLLAFAALSLCSTLSCSKGQSISVKFSTNPQLMEGSPVIWDQQVVGKVKSTISGDKNTSVLLVDIHKKFSERLNGQWTFYVDGGLFTLQKEQKLFVYICSERPIDHDFTDTFPGYGSSLRATSYCLTDRGMAWLNQAWQGAKDYWHSASGLEHRAWLEKQYRAAEDGAVVLWKDVVAYGEDVAAEMREQGYDKEAERFLQELQDKFADYKNQAPGPN